MINNASILVHDKFSDSKLIVVWDIDDLSSGNIKVYSSGEAFDNSSPDFILDGNCTEPKGLKHFLFLTTIFNNTGLYTNLYFSSDNVKEIVANKPYFVNDEKILYLNILAINNPIVSVSVVDYTSLSFKKFDYVFDYKSGDLREYYMIMEEPVISIFGVEKEGIRSFDYSNKIEYAKKHRISVSEAFDRIHLDDVLGYMRFKMTQSRAFEKERQRILRDRDINE